MHATAGRMPKFACSTTLHPAFTATQLRILACSSCLPAGVAGVVDWDEQFYDMLQNTVGGGKPKMRW